MPPAPKPVKPRVGVLFVHGIGEQQRGETLLGFGEPLRNFLHGWLGGGVLLTDTSLLRKDEGERAPAHVTLTAVEPDGDRRIDVLMAESWWAGRFPLPTFLQVATWLTLVIGPVSQRYFDRRFSLPPYAGVAIVRAAQTARQIAHDLPDKPLDAFIALARRFRPAYFRLSIGMVWLLIAVALRPLQNAVSLAVGLVAIAWLLALAVLGIVPQLRRPVIRMQLKLADVLGDSYVKIVSPFRFDSMVSQVVRDLEWLAGEQEVERIVVVAHSQGAEVARAAIVRVCEREYVVEKAPERCVESFITFGAGIARLEAVARLQENRGRAFGGYFVRLAAAAGPIAALLLGAGTGILVVALVVSAGMIYFAERYTRRLFERPTPEALGIPSMVDGEVPVRWRDYYASSDPVPEGPLLKTADYTESRRIHNIRSTLRDHSSYWRNSEQFVSRVAFEVARTAGWPAPDRIRPHDRVHLAHARRRRDLRTLLYGLERWLAVLAVGIFVLAIGPDGLRAITREALDATRWASESAYASAEPWLRRDAAKQAFGIVALVAGVIGAWHFVVAAGLWRGWDRAEAACLLTRRESPGRGSVPWQAGFRVAAVTPIAAALAVMGKPVLTVAAIVLPLAALSPWMPYGHAMQRGADASLQELAPGSGDVLPELKLGSRASTQAQCIAVGHGATWIAWGPPTTVTRLTHANGASQEFKLDGIPRAIACGDDAVWVTTDDHDVFRIDPGTCAVTTVTTLEEPADAIGVHDNSIWALHRDHGGLTVLDADSGNVLHRDGDLVRPTAISFSHSFAWIADRRRAYLMRVMLEPPYRMDRVSLQEHRAYDVVFAENALWAYLGRGLIARIDQDDDKLTIAYPPYVDPSPLLDDLIVDPGVLVRQDSGLVAVTAAPCRLYRITVAPEVAVDEILRLGRKTMSTAAAGAGERIWVACHR